MEELDCDFLLRIVLTPSLILENRKLKSRGYDSSNDRILHSPSDTHGNDDYNLLHVTTKKIRVVVMFGNASSDLGAFLENLRITKWQVGIPTKSRKGEKITENKFYRMTLAKCWKINWFLNNKKYKRSKFVYWYHKFYIIITILFW